MSIIDLARAVERAESTVRERIAAMERDGVLRGYRALVDPERLGYHARALVRADCDRRRAPELARQLAAIPQVTSAVLTTGTPVVIEVVAENLPRLEQVLEERLAPLDLHDLRADVVLRALVEPRPLTIVPPGAAVAVPARDLEPLGLPRPPGLRPEVAPRPNGPTSLALPSAR